MGAINNKLTNEFMHESGPLIVYKNDPYIVARHLVKIPTRGGVSPFEVNLTILSIGNKHKHPHRGRFIP